MIKIDKKLLKDVKIRATVNGKKIGNICAYCGIFGDHRDHVMPLSFFSNGRPYTYNGHYSNNNIVRACSECNVLASNIIFDNFWEKKKYIADMVSWRYKDLLKSPDWSKGEIEELEGTLKTYIKGCVEAKMFTIFRLENLNSPEICQ